MAACSRPSPDVAGDGTAQAGATPFETHGASTSEAAAPSGPVSPGALPFQNAQALPTGTLLTVELKSPLVADAGSRGAFEAVLDEAVILDGNVVIPRGAEVSGRIELVRISEVRPDRGFVRLVLVSVRVDDHLVPVQTASLFARQLAQSKGDAEEIRLEKGRRLTFRLTEQVFLSKQPAKADL